MAKNLRERIILRMSSKNEKGYPQKKSAWEHPLFAIALFALIIGVWLKWEFIVSALGFGEIPNKANEYADMFGGLNTLFTGLAFAAVAYTIILQCSQLKETRNELEKVQLDREFQRFETHFFALLARHDKLVETIESTTAIQFNGNHGFKGLAACLSQKYRELDSEHQNPIPSGADLAKRTFINIGDQQRDLCEKYVRSLLLLLAYIHEPKRIETATYLEIVRQSLSEGEQHLLLFAVFHPSFGEELKTHVENHSLLRGFALVPDNLESKLLDLVDPSARSKIPDFEKIKSHK